MYALDVREVEIAHRFRYAHSRHRHDSVRAVVCLLRGPEGRLGLGEAVPRRYVTGETSDSVIASLRSRFAALAAEDRLGASPGEVDVAEARAWEGPFPSGAFCALDLARQDLHAAGAGRSLAEDLGGKLPASLRYTASIGIAGRLGTLALTGLYRGLGLQEFKLKVGADDDLERLRRIRRVLGNEARIYADANAAWDRETAVRRIEELCELGIWAVEEPLIAPGFRPGEHGRHDHVGLGDAHYRDVRWIRERSPLPLIADESLIDWCSLEKIIEHEAFDILNLRLSKCGGPRQAAAMAACARDHGLRVSCGAMVGETPILATAGAHFAASRPERESVQGFSHRLLHRRPFVSGEPRLRRGQVELEPTRGLGLSLDETRLDELTVRRETWTDEGRRESPS